MEHTFSIGNGHTVVFSQGNLQYNRSNNEFRVALRQYEMLGAVNENLDDPTYDGWLDLFRFDDCKDLSIDEYRLLTIDEWRYILFHRDNAVNLFGFASIQVDEGTRINGFIIIPDGTVPEGFKHSYYSFPAFLIIIWFDTSRAASKPYFLIVNIPSEDNVNFCVVGGTSNCASNIWLAPQPTGIGHSFQPLAHGCSYRLPRPATSEHQNPCEFMLCHTPAPAAVQCER